MQIFRLLRRPVVEIFAIKFYPILLGVPAWHSNGALGRYEVPLHPNADKNLTGKIGGADEKNDITWPYGQVMSSIGINIRYIFAAATAK
jgi:hypothetical protein